MPVVELSANVKRQVGDSGGVIWNRSGPGVATFAASNGTVAVDIYIKMTDAGHRNVWNFGPTVKVNVSLEPTLRCTPYTFDPTKDKLISIRVSDSSP